MERHEVEALIDQKIRGHEIRVAIISGIVGGIVVSGLIHAIWLNHVTQVC